MKKTKISLLLLSLLMFNLVCVGMDSDDEDDRDTTPPITHIGDDPFYLNTQYPIPPSTFSITVPTLVSPLGHLWTNIINFISGLIGGQHQYTSTNEEYVNCVNLLTDMPGDIQSEILFALGNMHISSDANMGMIFLDQAGKLSNCEAKLKVKKLSDEIYTKPKKLLEKAKNVLREEKYTPNFINGFLNSNLANENAVARVENPLLGALSVKKNIDRREAFEILIRLYYEVVKYLGQIIESEENNAADKEVIIKLKEMRTHICCYARNAYVRFHAIVYNQLSCNKAYMKKIEGYIKYIRKFIRSEWNFNRAGSFTISRQL